MVKKIEVKDDMVTLSRDPKTRSSSVREEGKFLKEQRELRYPLHHGKPQYPIRWVYFVRDDLVGARAKCVDVRPEDYELTYQGVELEKSNYRAIVKAPMQYAKRRLRQKGFQGFQYVKDPAKFDRAFR